MSNPFEVSDTAENTSNTLPPGTRPPSATVFGILNLVFGVLGVCGSIFTLGLLVAFSIPDVSAELLQMEGMEQFQDGTYRAVLMGQTVVGIVLVGILIGSGIGLLKFQPWGRKLANWYAIPQIFMVVVGSAASFMFVVLPALDRASGPAEEAGAYFGMVGGVVGLLFGLLYPVLLLIFMNRKKFKDMIGA